MFGQFRVFERGVWAAAAVIALTVTQTMAQETGAACSAAYYTALSELRAAKGDDLAGAIAALRAADPVLPGQWIYSRALFAKTLRLSRPFEQERACLEKVKVAGRLRCARYADAVASAEPELPTELEITPPPSNDEMRVLKAVADLVDGFGAIPDVGANGRHTWVAQRATSDLKLYVNQPPHVALCSGAREVVEFYAKALKPLQKRVEDVGELVKKARLLAATRAVAATPSVATPSVAPGLVGEPSLPLAEVAKLPLVAMTAEAIGGVVAADDVATVRKETSALAALRRAKPALILAQFQAQKSEDAGRRERVLAAGRAVRMIEAAAYTEIYAERYRKFAVSVLALPPEIQAAYARTCTCGN